MKAADRDLRAMRRLLLDGAEDACEPELLLPSATLDGVRSLLDCASVSIGVIDSGNRTASPWQDLPVDPNDRGPGRRNACAVFAYVSGPAGLRR